mgnify:CR=1 FL=1
MKADRGLIFPANRRLRLAALATATIVAGLIWRFSLPGLPWFAWKYGGSLLWAAMVYFMIAVVMPKARWPMLLLIGFICVALVEYSPLYHAPWLEAFRLTLAGKLILGKVFSVWNLPAYWAGLIAAALLDAIVKRR